VSDISKDNFLKDLIKVPKKNIVLIFLFLGFGEWFLSDVIHFAGGSIGFFLLCFGGYFYLKNDELNDPLITKDRIELMNILSSDDLELIINLTLKVNKILKSFFKNIQLQLVDFKLEFGYDFKNNILLGDEISPDNCRLWDLNKKMISL